MLRQRCLPVAQSSSSVTAHCECHSHTPTHSLTHAHTQCSPWVAQRIRVELRVYKRLTHAEGEEEKAQNREKEEEGEGERAQEEGAEKVEEKERESPLSHLHTSSTLTPLTLGEALIDLERLPPLNYLTLDLHAPSTSYPHPPVGKLTLYVQMRKFESRVCVHRLFFFWGGGYSPLLSCSLSPSSLQRGLLAFHGTPYILYFPLRVDVGDVVLNTRSPKVGRKKEREHVCMCDISLSFTRTHTPSLLLNTRFCTPAAASRTVQC